MLRRRANSFILFLTRMARHRRMVLYRKRVVRIWSLRRVLGPRRVWNLMRMEMTRNLKRTIPHLWIMRMTLNLMRKRMILSLRIKRTRMMRVILNLKIKRMTLNLKIKRMTLNLKIKRMTLNLRMMRTILSRMRMETIPNPKRTIPNLKRMERKTPLNPT